MIKSSVKELIEKSKLLYNDLMPYFTSSFSDTLFSEMKIFLYNPELNEDELSTFIKCPEKYSFLDVINQNDSSIIKVIDVVGPKLSFLKEELTLFVIQFEKETEKIIK